MAEAPPPNDSASLNHQQHNKRKRSPPPVGLPLPGPLSKAPKTGNSNSNSNNNNNSNSSNNISSSSQLQINYIARQCADDLPFISKEDTLLGLVDVLSSYTQVLDRHESLASNLGARPLGPILIKRFERCFDAPPRVIASHSHARDQDLPQVTWLDVVHFAQAHPSQFTLSTFSEGRRVCQFYYPQKQVRVQISEEDFLFINSGRCQDLIPPLPIWEDEEKEVATCEIVEKALRELTAAADSVAARTRQLAHRLKGRRMAIQERRAVQDTNASQPQSHAQPAFSSVNAQHQSLTSAERLDPGTNIRQDLVKHFQSLPPKALAQADNRRISVVQQQQQPQSPSRSSHYQTPPPVSQPHFAQPSSSSVSPVPTTMAAAAATAAAANQIYQANQRYPGQYHDMGIESPRDGPKHNFSRPLLPSQEVSQPYRAICQTHMESLPRSSRVIPPCDRCRRLKMDCLKNLSSCAGCTKKHARCHWKDVTRHEVQGLEGFEDAERLAAEYDSRVGHDYETSDTSVDGDMTRRQSAEYENSNMNGQISQHQQLPLLNSVNQPHRPFEEPQPERPITNRPQPFTDEPTSQNPQPNTMDLMRLLGSDNSRDQSLSSAAESVRNNGAFKTYTPHAEQRSLAEAPARIGVSASNPLNNGVVEGERA